jgi:hypothetical protein
MRLKRTEVAEREAFLKDLFTNTPDTTAKAANDALAAKYGKRMRLARVYALKKGTPDPALSAAPAAV